MALPRMGTMLLLLGVAQIALAIANIHAPVAAGLLFWSGGAFAAVGLAYYRHAPGIFGKEATNGRLSPLANVLLLPFIFLTRLIWLIKVISSREEVFHEIAPHLFLGRRPRSAAELPLGTTLVIDLTSEFRPSRSMFTEGRDYRCLPTLDHAAPTNASAFTDLVQEVAQHTASPVYVHCAVGRGRSALFVAAVLKARGIAVDHKAAWEQVRQARSCVGLSAEQAAFLFG